MDGALTPHQALLRVCYVKALLRLCSGSVQALFRLCSGSVSVGADVEEKKEVEVEEEVLVRSSGAVKALLRRCSGAVKALLRSGWTRRREG